MLLSMLSVVRSSKRAGHPSRGPFALLRLSAIMGIWFYCRLCVDPPHTSVRLLDGLCPLRLAFVASCWASGLPHSANAIAGIAYGLCLHTVVLLPWRSAPNGVAFRVHAALPSAPLDHRACVPSLTIVPEVGALRFIPLRWWEFCVGECAHCTGQARMLWGTLVFGDPMPA